MSILPFLHIFAAVTYLYLAVYIFMKNPKALVNRLCVAFLFCFIVWTVPMVFFHNPYVSKDTARIATGFSSFGWCGVNSIYLWFMLAFTGKKKILKKKWFYLFLFGIPLLLIYKQWTGFLYSDYIMQDYGWKALWSNSTWPRVFYIYFLSFLAVGLYINIDFMRKAPNKILKKQAAIIFVTVMIETGLGTITEIILPLLNIHVISNISNLFLFIWGSGAVYAIARYKFLTITPAAAAENIISTMYDCLILLDMERKIITVNNAASNLLGYKPGELKGEHVSFLFGKEEITDGLFKKTVKEGSVRNKELIFKTRQGKEIPMLFSDSILKDRAGKAAGFVCVAKDISERKKLKEEIFKSKKLESLGILTGGIAHDFNNLFAVILGNLSLTRDEIPPGEKSYQFLANAEEISLKAADLARKFITLSPGGWLKKGKVILPGIINRALDSEPGLKKKNITFDIAVPPDLAPIDGDEFQLHQLMQNLFRNAVEAIPPAEGGRILLGAENMTIKEEVEIENKLFLKAGQYVKFIIEDNGIGIPPDNIEKIFDPYFSTKEKSSQKGMGLGLTLCYSIVKKHNGHMVVEAKEGKGTIVTIYLPAFS